MLYGIILSMKDDFTSTPEHEAAFASRMFGEVEWQEEQKPAEDIAAELSDLLQARADIHHRICEITGEESTIDALAMARKLVAAANNESTVAEPVAHETTSVDERDASTSVWTTSAGLPSLGGRR